MESNKNLCDSNVATLSPAVALRPPLASLGTQLSKDVCSFSQNDTAVTAILMTAQSSDIYFHTHSGHDFMPEHRL